MNTLARNVCQVVAAAAAMGLALGACTATPSAPPSGPPSQPPSSPSPTGSPTPSPRDPSPAPSTLPFELTGAAWTLLATLPQPSEWSTVGGMVGFSGGYVSLGDDAIVREAGPVAWYSADGRAWSRTPLMQLAKNCPDWGPAGDEMVWDGVARAIATNGSTVVVVGEVVDYASTPCGSVHPASWITTDGRTWQRSAPWPPSGTDLRASAAWPAPGGWQASSETALWESPDGVAWAPIPGTGLGASVSAAAAADGRVLIAADPAADPGGLLVSRDGRRWEAVAAPSECSGGTRILAPRLPGRDAWILGGVGICASVDLVTWTKVPLDIGVLGAAQTRYGAVVLGDRCYDLNLACDDRPLAFLSADGNEWVALPAMPSRGWAVSDGPSGVLVLAPDPAEPDSIQVWRLTSG